MSFRVFQMWEPFRESMIAEHNFYVEQARARVLSQFENIESEAEAAQALHLEKISLHFDPNRHEESSFHESAFEKGLEFYLLLSNMHDNMRLSVIAGMFHHWDKELRQWIVSEMRNWRLGIDASHGVWKLDFPAIIDFLEQFGIHVKAFPSYERLNSMRLVVNVFKHGNGQSFDELKKSFPEFIDDPLSHIGGFKLSSKYLDHSNLKVQDSHLDEFAAAILDFWNSIPQVTIVSEDTEIPKWMEKAIQKSSHSHSIGN